MDLFQGTSQYKLPVELEFIPENPMPFEGRLGNKGHVSLIRRRG